VGLGGLLGSRLSGRFVGGLFLGRLQLLVGLGARRFAGNQVLGLLDPLVAGGAATQRQLLVVLGEVGLAPAGDVVEARDARGVELLFERRADAADELDVIDEAGSGRSRR